MYKVSKTFKFPFGHRLSLHKGACRNPHGHNAKLKIQLSSNTLNENGMIIDFSDFKNIVNDIIIKQFDHSFILNNKDTEWVNKFESTGFNMISVGCEPTAENLCRIIFEKLEYYLSEKWRVPGPAIKVEFVRFWENDDSEAEYDGKLNMECNCK